MPKYTVLEKSYLPSADGSSRIYEAGETVDYDGLPGRNLEPLDDEGKAKQADYLASLEKLRSDRLRDFPPESQAAAEAFAKMLADERAKDKDALSATVAAAVASALAQAFPNGLNKPPAVLPPATPPAVDPAVASTGSGSAP